MREMRFATHTEYSFWGNVEFPTNDDAKYARDAMYREHKKLGRKCRRWVLKNQLRQYAGLGCPDGTIGDVYKLVVYGV